MQATGLLAKKRYKGIMIIDHFSDEISKRLVESKRQRDHRTAHLKVAYAPLIYREAFLPKILSSEVFKEMRATPRKIAPRLGETGDMLKGKAPLKFTGRPSFVSESSDERNSLHLSGEASYLSGDSDGDRLSAYMRPSLRHIVKLPSFDSADGGSNQSEKRSNSTKNASKYSKSKSTHGKKAASTGKQSTKRSPATTVVLPLIEINGGKKSTTPKNVKKELSLLSKPFPKIGGRSAGTRNSSPGGHSDLKGIAKLNMPVEIRLTRAMMVRNQHLVYKQKQKIVNQESMISKISRMRKFVKKRKPLGTVRDIEYILPASSSGLFFTSDLRAFRKKQLAECDHIHDYLQNNGLDIEKDVIINALVANEDYMKPNLPEEKVADQQIPDLLSYRLDEKIKEEALNELILGKDLHNIRSIIFSGIKSKSKKLPKVPSKSYARL